jgi:hypothetical protein
VSVAGTIADPSFPTPWAQQRQQLEEGLGVDLVATRPIGWFAG